MRQPGCASVRLQWTPLRHVCGFHRTRHYIQLDCGINQAKATHTRTTLNQTFQLKVIDDFPGEDEVTAARVRLLVHSWLRGKHEPRTLHSTQYALCLPLQWQNGLCLRTWNTHRFMLSKERSALTHFTKSQHYWGHHLATAIPPSSSVSSSSAITAPHPPIKCAFSCKTHAHTQSRTNRHFSPAPLPRKAPNDCSVLERKRIRETDEV